jgi:hypothetical protein
MRTARAVCGDNRASADRSHPIVTTEDTAAPTSVLTAVEFIDKKNRQWTAEREMRTKDIGRRGSHTWEREAWTFMVQSNLPEKVFVVERIRLVSVHGEVAYRGGAQPGDREYRLGYYTIGRIGRRAGQWTWGQFSPMIPEADLMPMLEKARAEGTIR